MSGPDVPEVLEKKVGPLPLGVWAAAILAGIGVAVVVRRNAGKPEPVAVVDEQLVDVGGVPPLVLGTGGGQPGMPYTGGDGTPAPTNPQRPSTNDEWRDQAAILVIARGYNPLTVVNALSKYLQGEQLDATEQGIVTVAIGLAGPPPQGAPPVTLIPLPTPGSSPTPAPTPTPDPWQPAPLPTPTPLPTGPTLPPGTYMQDGRLYNATTGRAAFTGPNGEPGYGPANPPAGTVSWTMPDGRTAFYFPGAGPGQHLSR